MRVRAFRSLHLPESMRRDLRMGRRERGFDEASLVESFVVLNAVGGECPDDFQHLRADAGLTELIGHALPSPEPARLLEWHREKAGAIETVHNILKNDLGAGVLPARRFGANAAWLRLAVLTLNLLTALKRLALPPELLSARPKRLRFLFFNTAGRIVRHARKMLLRLAMMAQRKTVWMAAFRLLPVAT